MRIGPKMLAAAAYVKKYGPSCIYPIARAVGPNGSTKFGYEIVWRAVAAGLLDSKRGKGNSYIVSLVESDSNEVSK